MKDLSLALRRSSWRGFQVFLLASVLLLPIAAFACDPCSLYNAARLQGLVPGTFSLSISEQNTSFDRPNGVENNSTRNGEFVRDFSTTQLTAAYDFNQQFGVQVTLPFIISRFDEVKNYRYQTQTDSGIGDLTLLGRYSFLTLRSPEWSVVAGLSGGIKLPTGDTGTLNQVAEEEILGSTKSLLRHHPVASASGGRVLTFGTGSTDFLVGSNLFSRYQRFLFLADVQYGIRTEGDYNYQFANDLIWSVGPGYYLALEHDSFWATRAVLTGEFKPSDSLNGSPVAGSSISNLYLGPEVLFSLANGISGMLGVDMRTTGEDPGSTIVPEYRIRAAIGYRFS
jgi:hypothetical protein